MRGNNITVSEALKLSEKWKEELKLNPDMTCSHPIECKEYDDMNSFSTGDIVCGVCGETLKTEADRR